MAIKTSEIKALFTKCPGFHNLIVTHSLRDIVHAKVHIKNPTLKTFAMNAKCEKDALIKLLRECLSYVQILHKKEPVKYHDLLGYFTVQNKKV